MTSPPPEILIKNWERFQHYRHRNPPWIRLYRDLVDNPDWRKLSDSAARLLVELWLLASELEPGGRVPYDPNMLAWRLGRASVFASEVASIVEELVSHGFISVASADASGDASADASTSTLQRGEGRGESTEYRELLAPKEKSKKPKTTTPRKRPERFLPPDWKPTDEHLTLAEQEGVELDREAEKFRDHAKATDRKLRDWNAAFRNWLRKAGEINGGPGDGSRKGPGDGPERIMKHDLAGRW